MRRLMLGLSAMLVGLVAVGIACGDSDGEAPVTATTATAATATATTVSPPVETSATRVEVGMAEWLVRTDPVAVKAGEVRFFVTNTGAVRHELVIVQSDADPAELPTYGAADTPAEGHAKGDVDEDKITSEGELEDIEPGATKDATFVLEPGNYVLICNLAGHYAAGMRVAFTVQ